VAWVEEGHMTLLHMIPHRTGLSRDPLCTSFPWPAHVNTTVHLMGQMGLAVQWPLFSLEQPRLQSQYCVKSGSRIRYLYFVKIIFDIRLKHRIMIV
jgi:hypothetical protein